MNKVGFSLIEIVVAIMIIGVMMVGAFSAFKYIGKAKVTKTQAKLSNLRSAIEFYKTSTNLLPTKIEDLLVKPANVKGWTGKFVNDEDELKDAWGNDFVYKVNPKGSAHPYELYSNGPQGEEGAESEAISIWEIQ